MLRLEDITTGLYRTNVCSFRLETLLVSVVVIYNAIGIIEHDKRRLGLPSAPVVMEDDNNRIKQRYSHSSKHTT